MDGGTLRADPGTWTGTPPPTFAFAWLRCDAGGEGCVPIPGATTDRYVVSPLDVDKRLRVAVTASNGDGPPVTARSPATAAVAAAAPTNTALPAVTGTPREGQVLTASKGQWTGTPPVELAVRWERCTPGGIGCAAIPGATRDSYALSSADVGSTVRVAVTASNRTGGATVHSPVTGVVALSPLVNLEPPAIVGVVQVGLPLMATTGRWAPSGPIDFLYRWYRCRADGSNCDPIAGATSARYEVRLLDVGYRLLVRVTAISDAGSSTRESALTTVVAAPPAATPREPELMRPFPRVRVQGYFTDSGAVLQRVSVRGPRGARIAVRCRGRDCPFRRHTRRSGARVRISSLERYLRAGTRIEIRVTRPGLIGKYTRIVIRAGRPPARRDRCVLPDHPRPVRCP